MEPDTALDMSKLEQLETRVKEAVALIGRLREERNALAERVQASELKVRSMEEELTNAETTNSSVQRLERERETLLRDRATVARKVEAILERMDVMGLE